MIDRDYIGEIRAALYNAHGTLAWEIAIGSRKDELIAYVAETTGGPQLEIDSTYEAFHDPEDYPTTKTAIKICGCLIATVRVTANGTTLHRSLTAGWTIFEYVRSLLVAFIGCDLVTHGGPRVDHQTGSVQWRAVPGGTP